MLWRALTSSLEVHHLLNCTMPIDFPHFQLNIIHSLRCSLVLQVVKCGGGECAFAGVESSIKAYVCSKDKIGGALFPQLTLRRDSFLSNHIRSLEAARRSFEPKWKRSRKINESIILVIRYFWPFTSNACSRVHFSLDFSFLWMVFVVLFSATHFMQRCWLFFRYFGIYFQRNFHLK